MKFIISFFAVFFLFTSANAMYQENFPGDALGITNYDLKNHINQVSYKTYIDDSNFDETLIDQLIASFSINMNQDVFDESLIDQVIASFPDTMESYRSKTPFNDISFYQMLIDTYKS